MIPFLKNNIIAEILILNVYMIYQETVITFKQIECGMLEEIEVGLQYVGSLFMILAWVVLLHIISVQIHVM